MRFCVGAVMRLFQCKDVTAGITPVQFATACRHMGVAATDVELQELFTRYDQNGDNLLQVTELARLVLPTDFSEVGWQIKR